MATHAGHPINYDATFTRRVVRHEQDMKWSMVAFAIAVIVMATIWVAFLRYL